MTEKESQHTLKRFRHRYRLVVMNDDTYEEVVTFKLTRLSVYILLSITFVLLVGFTIILLMFTPLKYYVPGYGSNTTRTQLINLKTRTDSLEQALQHKDIYLENLRKTLTGNIPIAKDTQSLKLPKEELLNE